MGKMPEISLKSFREKKKKYVDRERRWRERKQVWKKMLFIFKIYIFIFKIYISIPFQYSQNIYGDLPSRVDKRRFRR